jgi:glutamine synthetase
MNRGAMVRIPYGNERSARIEVRSVAPDANPYLALYALVRTGLEGPKAPAAQPGEKRVLPDNIQGALRHFTESTFITQLVGENVQAKYAELKQASADRCPKQLGARVKTNEIQFHHEVTNQYLWSQF